MRDANRSEQVQLDHSEVSTVLLLFNWLLQELHRLEKLVQTQQTTIQRLSLQMQLLAKGYQRQKKKNAAHHAVRLQEAATSAKRKEKEMEAQLAEAQAAGGHMRAREGGVLEADAVGTGMSTVQEEGFLVL